MNGVPEEVKEDPNEQTYSEFPTKRTNQGKVPLDYNTISSIKKILPGEEQPYKKHLEVNAKNNDKFQRNKEHTTDHESHIVMSSKPQIIVEPKITNFASIDKSANFPESKSVSLSFSSKHPDEDEFNNRLASNIENPPKASESQFKQKETNKIMQRMKFIKQGLDSLNNNLQKFEKDLIESKNIEKELGSLYEASRNSNEQNLDSLKSQQKNSKKHLKYVDANELPNIYKQSSNPVVNRTAIETENSLIDILSFHGKEGMIDSIKTK